MSVLVGKHTRLLVQGITGKEGSFQTRRCIEYGTNVVAGVTPGRGGETAEGVPVFPTVAEAVAKTDAHWPRSLRPAAVAGNGAPRAASPRGPIRHCLPG